MHVMAASSLKIVLIHRQRPIEYWGGIQWRIQDFPQEGAPTPKIAIIFHIFAENCMKMKEFGSPGGARVPGAPLGSANGIDITHRHTSSHIPIGHCSDVICLSL